MPEIDSIEVSYSRKVQLEQFEPIRHSATLNVSLEEGDDPDEVYDEYVDRCEDMVERAIAERVAATKLAGDE